LVKNSANTDAHHLALESLLRAWKPIDSVKAVMVYGSFTRGMYNKGSDLDIVVELKAKQLCEADVRSLLDGLRAVQRKYGVKVDPDFMLDREIRLFRNGILLDGRAFSDEVMYRKDGRMVYGPDFRRGFQIPTNLGKLKGQVFDIVYEEVKRWAFRNPGRRVPWWFPSWAVTLCLNTSGILELNSHEDGCQAIEKLFPSILRKPWYQKFKTNPQADIMTVDEFLVMLRFLERPV
jgi:predicted nucleotidyltransferase